jgi:hypothetical protein
MILGGGVEPAESGYYRFSQQASLPARATRSDREKFAAEAD